jgi:polyhydroxybutyrate depolymerase
MARSRWRKVAIGAATTILALAGGGFYLGFSPGLPPPSDLRGSIAQESLSVGGRTRTYDVYVPTGLPKQAPLLIVLHGSTQNGRSIREFSGYEFDRLADADKFVVAYPDGHEGNWNDCRRAASYPARLLDIDDKGFMEAIVAHLATRLQIDPARVFVAGYSNGGHMAFRLALEVPDRFAGIGVISANLPADDNSICRASGRAVPLVIVNGTRDPINPYSGGNVSLFGFANRGAVVSSAASAARFAALFPQARETAQAARAEQADVEETAWEAEGARRVALYSVVGGGHVIPQPHYAAPRILGRTDRRFNAPGAIWRFFAALPPRS